MPLFLRRLLASAALAIGVLPMASTSAAAQSGSITGKVTDAASGRPIENAQIQAQLTGGQAYGAISGADGSFRVVNLPDGSYTVTVRALGFEQRVFTNQRPGATVDAAMTERPTQLGQTVVTASRSRPEKALDAPAQISVISSERIAERPAVTVSDQLRGIPGVDVNRGGIAQANIVARGFNNAFSGSILMLQDYRFAGVPSLRVNVPFLMTGTNEDIDRIEVLLGPASALYGPNSANGVLHVITKSPFSQEPGRKSNSTISVDGGERSLLRIGARTAVKLNEKAAFKLSGESMRADDWEYRDPSEPANFPNAAPAGRRGTANNRDFGLERFTGEARLDLRPRDGVEFITTYGLTKVGSGIELTGANGSAQIQDWTYSSVQQRMRWGRFFAQAFMNSSNAGNDDSLDVAGTYLLRSGQPIVDKSKVWALQAQHGFDMAGGAQSFTYGVDYIATNPETGGTINGRNEADDNTREYGGYLQSSSRVLNRKLEILTALRVDQNNVIEGTFFSPRAALIFKPAGENHSFRATFNRAFQTPANFTFFLDLVQSRAAGLNPYDVYAQGNKPKEGFQFPRSCTAGSAYGTLCMRSPFTQNAGFQTVSAGSAMPGVWTALTPAVQPTLTAGVTQALIANFGMSQAQAAGFAAQLTPALLQRLASRVPTEAELPTGLFIGQNLIADASGPADVAPLRASYNNTFELGYKGQLAKGRVLLDISGWRQQRGDVGTSAGQATPIVLARSPQAYGTYVTTQWAPVIQGAAAQAGLNITAAQAQAFAAGLAAGVVPTAAALPLGVVTWDEAAGGNRRILATYFNSGTEKLWVSGIDMAATFQATQNLGFTANFSHQDKTIFADIAGGNAAPLMSNSPGNRGSLLARFEGNGNSWSLESRFNYSASYEVNSGVYGTTASWPIAAGNTGATGTAAAGAIAGCPTSTTGRFCYDGVPEIFTVDVGLSKRFDIGAQKLRWSLNATNLLNEEVRTFPGVPQIGRMVMTRLQYTF
ncbi:MAG: TonB-dependent receptor [Gemmatimonadaceae bacterium]|nr:TonB-dependent receptor [Gemmatimonadaceae bacterium]